jgi:hypothetical protein
LLDHDLDNHDRDPLGAARGSTVSLWFGTVALLRDSTTAQVWLRSDGAAVASIVLIAGARRPGPAARALAGGGSWSWSCGKANGVVLPAILLRDRSDTVARAVARLRPSE